MIILPDEAELTLAFSRLLNQREILVVLQGLIAEVDELSILEKLLPEQPFRVHPADTWKSLSSTKLLWNLATRIGDDGDSGIFAGDRAGRMSRH